MTKAATLCIGNSSDSGNSSGEWNMDYMICLTDRQHEQIMDWIYNRLDSGDERCDNIEVDLYQRFIRDAVRSHLAAIAKAKRLEKYL